MTPPFDSRWSACAELLFAPETGDVAERIRLAADAGFAAVEFWSWRDKDLDAVQYAPSGTTGSSLRWLRGRG